jgi:hypothetical protein
VAEKAEVKPTEAAAVEAVTEEKPTKPKAKRTRKAKPSTAVEKEETDATTETGEIQKES